ncbi:503_t:CDS:2 [Funneliformis mosseae]|uniref:503_t:CDS:1 n=1 Tax=Funneliformis mosseae TaxID=27381 RepID=A0A9N9D8T7_FUNMO|nr:503_t:CDS:2 [Funneliformis mosseae]
MNTRSKASNYSNTNNDKESRSSSKIGYKGGRNNVTDRYATKQILEEEDDILIYHGRKRKAEREEEHLNEVCCEICLDWFHPECVGVSEEYCKDPNTFYVCTECRQLQVPCAFPDCRISRTFKAPAYWSTDLGEKFKVIKDECAKMTRCKKCDLLQSFFTRFHGYNTLRNVEVTIENFLFVDNKDIQVYPPPNSVLKKFRCTVHEFHFSKEVQFKKTSLILFTSNVSTDDSLTGSVLHAKINSLTSYKFSASYGEIIFKVLN